MAPKQLLLEGPAIEPLLERVWAEHGSDVRIVKAERVRVGGVAGFFAREQFEVTVEVPDTEPASTPQPPRQPRSTTTTATAARPAPAPRAPQDAAAARAARSAPTAPSRPATPAAPAASGLEALLAAAERGDADGGQAPPAAPAPRASAPSTPSVGDDFDAIFGAVTGGLPLSPAARAVAEAFAAQAQPSAPPAIAADDDPWVDGPPPGTTPRSPRSLVGRVAEPPAPPAPAAPAQPAEPVADLVDLDEPEPLERLEEVAPELFAPAAVLPETPSVEPWRAPWESEVAAEHASRASRTGEVAAAELEAPFVAAVPAPARTSAATAAPPAPVPGLRASPLAPAPVPAAVQTAVPAAAVPVPRRVGRSFAPLPASPAPDGYSLQRSAVLRLPETDPRLAPLGTLVEALVDDDAPAWAPTLSAPAAVAAPAAYAPVPAPVAPAPAPFAPAAEPPSDRRAADRLAQRLAALGVPVPWLWDLPQGRTAAMRELARRIGSAPVQTRTRPVADPVVVVLADLEDALPVAQHLATGMGLGEEDVVVMGRRVRGVAPERCLPSRQELQEAAADARAEHRSLVVVLPAPIGATPPVRAAVADTLERLTPDEVWAVVDATRRLDDTAAWLEAVAGERGVDALALTNTDVTSAPAAALALPAPVVLVGDRPATPEAWVSMLAARLAEQELR